VRIEFFQGVKKTFIQKIGNDHTPNMLREILGKTVAVSILGASSDNIDSIAECNYIRVDDFCNAWVHGFRSSSFAVKEWPIMLEVAKYTPEQK
jgi:hypothetical protein